MDAGVAAMVVKTADVTCGCDDGSNEEIAEYLSGVALSFLSKGRAVQALAESLRFAGLVHLFTEHMFSSKN